MGKRVEYTPDAKIKNVLHQLFMRSRERAKALKRTGYKCTACGAKQTHRKDCKLSLHVHHANKIAWKSLIEEVRKTLLCDSDLMIPLCPDCHAKEHEKNANV